MFLGLKENDHDAEPPAGRVVFLCGNGIQPTLTLDKNGLFTTVVADALKGKADSKVTSRTASAPTKHTSTSTSRSKRRARLPEDS